LFSLERGDEAVAYLESLAAAEPGNSEIQCCLGAALLAAGQHEAAAAAFYRAAEMNPEDPMAHAGLGEVFAALDQRAEAIAHLQIALRLDPALESARALLETLQSETATP
jgi:ribosomal protein S12 methylthiotransferase accessory factor